MRKFDIHYNDGAYYGTITFENSSQEEIEKVIQQEITDNDKNINPMYHITKRNFQEV